jgi:uncharacterized protein YwlG (UPF0340 family)
MSTRQITMPHGHLRAPAVTALVISALAIAVGTGIGFRTVEARNQAPAAVRPIVEVTPVRVTGGTMSDAAYQAFHAAALSSVRVTGGTMSDAAYQAFHTLALTAAPVGSTGGTMSDAAYQAFHSSTLTGATGGNQR